MKILRFKQIVFFTSILLLPILIVLNACKNSEQDVPAYQPIDLSPSPELTIEQLVSDYMTDEVAADAKYKGKRFQFTDVVVEEVSNNILDHRAGMGSDICMISGSVQFVPRYPTGCDHITDGFVVEIVGECRGIFFDKVYVRDCWIGVIEGDPADLPIDDY
jgi:hypothetical protein